MFIDHDLTRYHADRMGVEYWRLPEN
ncbi:hypothetical protein [Escherichia coli]